jgi:hypothetical protein
VITEEAEGYIVPLTRREGGFGSSAVDVKYGNGVVFLAATSGWHRFDGLGYI